MSAIWNMNYSAQVKNVNNCCPKFFPANRTSLVQMHNTNTCDVSYEYYRCRNCDTNLNSNTPAAQYQKQKLIQNTVRIDSSQYTMNLGSLAGYQNTNIRRGNVPWNQMSDRAEPSVQKANANGGNTIGSSSTRHSIVRLRPGSMSPGGVGCDIKHNSYERYLNRLKGKAPLRRGVVPPTFGLEEIPFNRAFPVYGGKVMKTSIVAGCNCPIVTEQNNYLKLYQSNTDQNYNFNVGYQFGIGQNVYVPINGKQQYAVIVANLGDGLFTIKLANGSTITANQNDFAFRNPNTCNCCANGANVTINSLTSQGADANPVNQFINDAGAVVGCQKLNGSISNITNTMNFFPSTNALTGVSGNADALTLLIDDGIRYTNGIASNVNL